MNQSSKSTDSELKVKLLLQKLSMSFESAQRSGVGFGISAYPDEGIEAVPEILRFVRERCSKYSWNVKPFGTDRVSIEFFDYSLKEDSND